MSWHVLLPILPHVTASFREPPVQSSSTNHTFRAQHGHSSGHSRKPKKSRQPIAVIFTTVREITLQIYRRSACTYAEAASRGADQRCLSSTVDYISYAHVTS